MFHPKAIGNNRCHAHVQCDSIIMDNAEISSIPEIDARHVDAQIIHEAAIGRINDEQLTKLRNLKGAVYFLKSTRHLLNCSFILQNLFTDIDPFF